MPANAGKRVAMKSFKWGCLLAVLVVMTGCGEPVMPPTGPLTAVPGERALEGDPWVPSDLWAPLRPLWGDVSGWGQPPGHHAVLAVAVHGRRDPRVPAPCVAGLSRTVTISGPVIWGFAPGTSVPARFTCVGGRFLCLPFQPGCPAIERDAGCR